MRKKSMLCRLIMIIMLFLVAKTTYAETFPLVTGAKANGYSYNGIKVTWDNMPGAIGYKIYRFQPLYDGYGEDWNDAYIYSDDQDQYDHRTLIAEVGANETSYIDKSLPSNSLYHYGYIIRAVYSGGISDEGYAAFAREVDTISTDAPPETSAPVLLSIDAVSSECYCPGEIKITFTGEDDTGISSVAAMFRGEPAVINFEKEVYIGAGRHKVTVSIPVSSTRGEGDLSLIGFELRDKYGNRSVYSVYTYLQEYHTTVKKEFDIEFTGTLSNRNAVSQVTQMNDDKTVVLKIDSASNGILKKEYLDAIKGTNKKLVVYVDDVGSMQWVFQGKKLTGATKDLDLNVSLKKVSGLDYGINTDILRLEYADNGVLPGAVNFRLKSPYINAINAADNLYLYFENGSNLSLENTNCKVFQAEDAAWCYYDLSHNSSFVLSGKKLNVKKAHVWDAGKVTKAATCAAAGEREYTCKGCGEKKTEVIEKTASTHAYGSWTVTSAPTALKNGTKARTCTICGSKEEVSIPKLTPILKTSKTSVKIQKTKTKSIKVTSAKGDIVSVKSSNRKIATAAYKNGILKITAKKKAGKANIIVTTKTGKKAVVKVTVLKAKTTKITCKAVNVKKGKKVTLKPKVTPVYSDDKVTYTTSNKKIATVSAKGVVTGKKKGTAYVTIKSGRKKVKVKVTVK